MVESLSLFFATNNFIVYSVYGQVFFVMGLAVAFVRTKHSQLPLARSLWLLAGFGIAHAFYEWAFVFIPVQATYMPAPVIEALHVLHYVLGTLSFALLLQFGIALVAGPHGFTPVKALPAIGFLAWLALLAAGPWLAGRPPTVLEGYLEVAMRYGLALPASLLTAYGLLRQARSVREMDMPHIADYLRLAAVAFASYALPGGLVVPRVDLPPAVWLNYDALLAGLGIPAAVFRSLCGLAIAYFVVRSLQMFDVEFERFLSAAERAQVLAAERERIGRDLHDGIIQSLYAAGLALEDASYTVPVDQQAAQAKIRNVLAALDGTIGQIRSFIYNLNMAIEGQSLAAEAAALVKRFGSANPVVEFIASGQEPPLSRAQRSHLLQILHEALSNVAKHARARRAEVRLHYRPQEVELSVRDDGVGFEPAAVAAEGTGGYRQGLRNIAQRARELGGTVEIRSAPGRGTTLIVSVPVGGQTARPAVAPTEVGERG